MNSRNAERAVAIDGPSASGKSTVARGAAAKLAYVFVDSGSFYRGMTWKILEERIPLDRPDAIAPLLDIARWSLRVEQGAVVFAIDGKSLGAELRGEAVRETVSDVSAIPEVRRFLVSCLRETTRFGDIVMEGRDIGTVVFPESRFKFYMDASPEERARRRLGEIVVLEGQVDISRVQASLLRRDIKDRTRPTAPLQIAPDAEVIDTTRLGIDEVVAIIVSGVKAGREGNRA